jgi:oxalate decarboxylase
MASDSRHVFHLESSKPYFSSPVGTIRKCTSKELPILNGMSLKRLTLQAKGIREPHWHANANELTYCLSGSALVNIIDSHSKFASFTIKAGQMFHVASGSLHHIENLSDTEPAEFLVCFSDEKPEDFSLGAAYGAMTPAVLGNTYNLPTSAFDHIKFSVENKEIVEREGAPSVPDSAQHQDVHKFDVEGAEPSLQGEGIGNARLAKGSTWPYLDSMAMYSLRVEDTAMREVSAELIQCVGFSITDP